MTDIRVVVADDHPIVRAGLTALLDSLAGITVVATATDGRQAVREVLLHRPEVAIVDLRMPVRDGFETIAELSRAAPEVAVLVLTMFEDDSSILAAVRAGAAGYLVKGAEPAEIERAIRAVAAGQALFGSAIATRVLATMSDPTPAAPPFPQLTGREREVLSLLAGALPNSIIARRLGLSAKTVANHLSTIFAKLGVSDRTQAILLAREAGLQAEAPSGPGRDAPSESR